MSDRSLLLWVLSSFTGVLIIFIAVPMGLNDPTHVDHMMAQFFGYMGFAISIMSAFYGLWAIYIYEPEKIRIEEKPFCTPPSIEETISYCDRILPSQSSEAYYHYLVTESGLDDLDPADRLSKIKSLLAQLGEDIETTDLNNTHDTYLKLHDLLFEVEALYHSK